MELKRKRLCVFCYAGGITVEFHNGNAMKRHMRVRHPQSKSAKKADKARVKEFRKAMIVQRARFHVND